MRPMASPTRMLASGFRANVGGMKMSLEDCRTTFVLGYLLECLHYDEDQREHTWYSAGKREGRVGACCVAAHA